MQIGKVSEFGRAELKYGLVAGVQQNTPLNENFVVDIPRTRLEQNVPADTIGTGGIPSIIAIEPAVQY